MDLFLDLFVFQFLLAERSCIFLVMSSPFHSSSSPSFSHSSISPTPSLSLNFYPEAIATQKNLGKFIAKNRFADDEKYYTQIYWPVWPSDMNVIAPQRLCSHTIILPQLETRAPDTRCSTVLSTSNICDSNNCSVEEPRFKRARSIHSEIVSNGEEDNVVEIR